MEAIDAFPLDMLPIIYTLYSETQQFDLTNTALTRYKKTHPTLNVVFPLLTSEVGRILEYRFHIVEACHQIEAACLLVETTIRGKNSCGISG
uniref:AlNc14C235G9382 protein n=1 Tax=Albugo laibachii Nc14 TaxID=890382 RepID=F0WSN8_9STRA|nr:AlNc14C235G9382 [Albugo laibachii Nc14]CCA27276.1 AlNc14C498G11930 [Albugo laibachii Nc14]|eukprot:CCA27276.1 AlNc14C498G11930 [Albugo laibachii Nc14]